jgi:GEVED domain/Secretion system C-terminal sorting domain
MKYCYLLFMVCLVLCFNPCKAQYCPCFSSGGSECITNVTLNTINNTTVGCATGNYSLQPGSTNLVIGNSYTISVTIASVGKVSVWMDFNHNFIYEASEWFQPYTAASAGSVTFTVPASAAYGLVGMRVRSSNSSYANGAIDACNTIFTGETEDYTINLLPAVSYDPAIVAINTPSGNCFSSSSTVTAILTNYGLLPINLATNPVTITLNVNGPNGLNSYQTTIATGSLLCCGANSINALITGLNLYNGGNYVLNTSLTIGTSGGVNNAILNDDSLSQPKILINKRPLPNSPYVLCQGLPIPFGQGLGVTGCATQLTGTAVISFTVSPCIDNVGATSPGSSIGPPANCSNQYACTFASGIVPALPPGASFTQPGLLTITNLNSAFPDEVRFNVFGSIPNGPSLFSACPTPYNVGSNDINAGGLTIGTQSSFSYVKNISVTSLSAMYSMLIPGGTVNVGYFEAWNDTLATADCYVNALGNQTTVTLSIPYEYTPSSIEWYDVPVGGTSLYGLSPFDPFATPNIVVNNSNTPGTYIFYAACNGTSSCRTPDTLQIIPSPFAFQDTISLCENVLASNSAIFNLTTLNSGISGGNPYDSIEYYYDLALVSELPYPASDTTSSIVHYSKMYLNGCYSSDSIIVQVNSLPDIQLISNNGLVCAPNTIDISTLINPFSLFPPGSDTLYYADSPFTLPYPNPHSIAINDSVYIVAITNTLPACTDTAIAIATIGGLDSSIVNQSVFNISDCTAAIPIPQLVYTLNDGDSYEFQSPIDCRRAVHITDISNGVSLGATIVDEEIDCTTQSYQGQFYLKRHFKIESAQKTAANLCLYFLQDDVDEFNTDAANAGQIPFTPNLSNLCVSKINNGTLNDSNHTTIVIDSSLISTSYDSLRTIWTACFSVDSFSYFYCHVCNSMNVALPMNLKYFNGRKTKNESILEWATLQESNVDYFILERSKNGKLFSPLSNKIESKGIHGNSSVELKYLYTDAMPLSGYNYYRLVQFDKDGGRFVSPVVKLKFDDAMRFVTYPNPVRDLLHVNLFALSSQNIQLQLVDITGRLVYKDLVSVVKGDNEITISTKALSKGIYILSVKSGSSQVLNERIQIE